MRKSLLLFVLLTALSAGLLAGACAAVQGRREAVSYRAEILAGDPAAADGVELTVEIRLPGMTTNFVNEISALPGVRDAVLVSYNGDYMG